MEKQRLDKLISSQQRLSRSEARCEIRRGKAEVNGVCIRDPSKLIDINRDSISFGGQAIQYKKHIYLLMNKPAGVLSASNDKTRETVVDLVPDRLRRPGIFPVGRLDKDTTGLLLLTDDGVFAHEVISPKKKISKSYLVRLDRPVTPEMPPLFLKGVTLADGTVCRPAILERLDGNNARIILCEGKYHEVKRMFGTVGLGVESLHRESIGELQIPDNLAIGDCVEMSEKLVVLAQKPGPYTF